MSSRMLYLVAALIAMASASVFEGRVILQQRDELRTLQKRIADASRQTEALRREVETTQREVSSIEKELADQPPPAPVDAQIAARQSEMSAWVARVKHLKRLFAERTDQRIPEMQWLTDDDWLRVAKRASFDDEHGTRKALGELRSSAKQKFFTRLGPALREYARISNGTPPSSIVAVAPHFESTIDVETLQRYEIIKSNSGNNELLVRESSPVDADYDSRTQMTASSNGNGGLQSMNPPFAWMPDFQERMRRAYRAYTEANQGARPQGIAQAISYFNPPLEQAKTELLLRFERESGR